MYQVLCRNEMKLWKWKYIFIFPCDIPSSLSTHFHTVSASPLLLLSHFPSTSFSPPPLPSTTSEYPIYFLICHFLDLWGNVCVYDLEPCGCWLTMWLTRRHMYSEGSVTSQELCIFCWTSCCCLLAAGQIKQYMMLLSSWRAKQMVSQTARDPQPTCCAGLL